MINTAEQQEAIDRLKEAYKLYDKRYDAIEEANWAEHHLKPGYMSKNDALYYLWLINKLSRKAINMICALDMATQSISQEPKCEAESWMNDGKREILKLIIENLEEYEGETKDDEEGEQT